MKRRFEEDEAGVQDSIPPDKRQRRGFAPKKLTAMSFPFHSHGTKRRHDTEGMESAPEEDTRPSKRPRPDDIRDNKGTVEGTSVKYSLKRDEDEDLMEEEGMDEEEVDSDLSSVSLDANDAGKDLEIDELDENDVPENVFSWPLPPIVGYVDL